MRGPAPQLEVMLTSATLSVALIGVVSGLFGMNLHNTHEDSYDTFVIVRPLNSPNPRIRYGMSCGLCKLTRP